MARRADVVFFWSPRVAGFALVGLLAATQGGRFEGSSLFGVLTALLLQLAPAVLAVLLLVVAWEWEPFGAVAFPALGVAVLAIPPGAGGRGGWIALVGMLFLTGVLFLCGCVHRRHHARPA
jgi:hypothetical protein